MTVPKHVSRQGQSSPTAAMAAILENTAAHCGSADDLFAELGIAKPNGTNFDQILQNMRRDQLASLGKRCIQYLMKRGEEHGGLPPMEPSDYNMLCICIINCHTLGEAIERAGEFCRMLRGRGGELSLQVTGEDAELFVRRFYTSDTWEDFFVDFFSLFSWHKLFCWMIGEYIPVYDVYSRYRKFLDYDITSMFFPCQVRWSQVDNKLRFPARFLESRIVQNYDALVELLKTFPNDLTSPSFGARKLSDDVRSVYVDALAKGDGLPTIEKLVQLFGLSEATLRRRLTEEGVSAEILKDECRRDRAYDYLRETAMTLEEIAGRLGFSCAKTFRTAFTRWTGRSPSAFRRTG